MHLNLVILTTIPLEYPSTCRRLLERKDVSQEPSRLHLELRHLEELAQSLKAVRTEA